MERDDGKFVGAWQLERGANATPHYQGFLRFPNAVRATGVKEVLGERAHIEAMRGSPKRNYEYCTKIDGRIEGPFILGDPMDGVDRDWEI